MCQAPRRAVRPVPLSKDSRRLFPGIGLPTDRIRLFSQQVTPASDVAGATVLFRCLLPRGLLSSLGRWDGWGGFSLASRRRAPTRPALCHRARRDTVTAVNLRLAARVTAINWRGSKAGTKKEGAFGPPPSLRLCRVSRFSTGGLPLPRAGNSSSGFGGVALFPSQAPSGAPRMIHSHQCGQFFRRRPAPRAQKKREPEGSLWSWLGYGESRILTTSQELSSSSVASKH